MGVKDAYVALQHNGCYIFAPLGLHYLIEAGLS